MGISKFVFVVLFYLLAFCFQSKAQRSAGDFGKIKRDSIIYAWRYGDSVKEQRDVIDIANSIIKPKKKRTIDTVHTKKKGKVYYSVLPGIGFALQTAIGAITSANVSFYSADLEGENLSSITLVPSYAFNHQFFVSLISDIWSAQNRLNWLGDDRFYRYPTVVYGLGGKTTPLNADIINYSYLRIHQVVAKQVKPDFLLGLGYDLDYHWAIKENGTKDGRVSDFRRYGFDTRSVSSGISLNVIYDSRKNINNPLGGYYVNLALRPNFTFLGSDVNWQSIQLDARKYIRLSPTSKNILAFWCFDWLALSGRPPYLDLPAIGWDTYSNTGRGYVQDRFKGTKLVYLETEYRFGLTQNGLLGGVVFANALSVTEWPVDRFETINPGIGTGIRIKINKGANTNLCIDYGVGLHGSNGFFFNLGEVF